MGREHSPARGSAREAARVLCLQLRWEGASSQEPQRPVLIADARRASAAQCRPLSKNKAFMVLGHYDMRLEAVRQAKKVARIPPAR